MDNLKTSFTKDEMNLEKRSNAFPISQVTAQHEVTVVSVEKEESNAGRAYVKITVEINGMNYVYFGNLLYFKLLDKSEVEQLKAASKSTYNTGDRLYYDSSTIRDLGFNNIVKDVVVTLGDEINEIDFNKLSKFKIVGVELPSPETNPLTGESYGQPHPAMSFYNYREFGAFKVQRDKDAGKPQFFELYDFLGHLPTLKPHIAAANPDWWSHRLLLTKVDN